jgi:rhomboid protease GluP
MHRLVGDPVSPTRVLILTNILAYVCTSIVSGGYTQTSREVLISVGQSNQLVLNGYLWQLFTSIFVHVNLVHLMGNMIFLMIFGIGAEALFSRRRYLIVYITSGLFGSVLSLLTGANSISAGASGAIFGLFGAVTIYSENVNSQSILLALFFSLYFLVLNIGVNVNVYAHAGGLVVGLILGYHYSGLSSEENR